MYIGIYINESNIFAGLLNQDEEVIPIGSIATAIGNKFVAIPLKIYIEDNFAYVGTPVNHLIANDYGLNYAKYFLDDLQHPEKTIYTDPTGKNWNASALLAIFLKKIKNDTSVFNEVQIQGAMVTTTKAVTPTMMDAMKLAFDLVDLPLFGVVDLGKTVWYGSRLSESPANCKKLLVYNLDNKALTTSVVTIDIEHFTETLFLESDKNLGENTLQENIITLLAKTYLQMTGQKIKKTAKNALALKKMVKNLLFSYFSKSELYIRIVYTMTEPALELVLTRAQMSAVLKTYMQQSLSFLKKTLSSANIPFGDIDVVVLTGESQLLQLVPSTVNELFDSQKTSIHHQNSTEVIIKGITLLANDAIEREINSSLMTKPEIEEKPESSKKNVEASQKIVKNPNPSDYNLLIQDMQINRFADMP